MESNKTEKCKTELRAPSPGSVSISSVNSIRPLEWDSGADIGYQNTTHSNLSTVERMALANGSAALFNAGNPIAESSPFIKTNENTMENTQTQKPLVDYSIDDESNDSIQELSSNIKSGTESKSMEDLRSLKANTLNGFRSRSSQNICSTKYPSTSSISTVVRQEIRRKYSNKGVQVDDELLKMDFSNEKNHSTYTMKSSRTSDNESVDGGSFEYVPGSEYNSRSRAAMSNSESSVNTFCAEVVDGVNLVTKYVNNLNISNKKKVLKKVAQSLIKNLDKELCSGSEKVSENSLKYEVNLPEHGFDEINERCPSIYKSMLFKPIEKPATVDKAKSSESSKSLSRYETSTMTSMENENHVKRMYEKNKSRMLESTDFSKTTNESNSYAISATETSGSPNLYSLKKYLAKEREAQLLWIKSGIEHLNNLRALYESQKILSKNFSSYKKTTSKQTSTTGSELENQCHSDLRKSKRTFRPHRPLPQISTDQDNSSHSTPKSILMERTEKSNKKLIVKYYKPKSQKTENCNCKNCNRNFNITENKENLERSCDKRKLVRPSPKRPIKKPISYTVLFDKNSFHSQMVEQTKTFSQTTYCKGEKNSNLNLNFNPLQNHDPSLQEYLIQNKPDYVDRAEFRRQCLFEIAQLRELRDKSKNELLSLIDSDDSNLNKLRNNLPPAPLTVLRIFNDRTLKKQTAMKYQQLPEVQRKKLELKRKENNKKNLLMAKVFTKKLQKRVLKGQVNLSNSTSVISS